MNILPTQYNEFVPTNGLTPEAPETPDRFEDGHSKRALLALSYLVEHSAQLQIEQLDNWERTIVPQVRVEAGHTYYRTSKRFGKF